MTDAVRSRLSKPLHEELEDHEHTLLAFAERLSFVLSVQEELKRVTRNKAFTIRGLSMWNMALSTRDMVIIDIASWAKALYSKSGLLKRIQGADLRALAVTWKHDETEAEEVLQANQAARETAFKRLFPGAKGQWPNQHEDMAGLVARTCAKLDPIVTDRSEHRAHRFEGKQAMAAMLAPTDVVPQLAICQEILADLRMLASNYELVAYGYPLVEAHPTRHDAQDVVDLIVCGPIWWIVDGPLSKNARKEEQFYWKKREAYYERLHAEHDARGAAGAPFNEQPLPK